MAAKRTRFRRLSKPAAEGCSALEVDIVRGKAPSDRPVVGWRSSRRLEKEHRMQTFPRSRADAIRDYAGKNGLGTIRVEEAGHRCVVTGDNRALMMIKLAFA